MTTDAAAPLIIARIDTHDAIQFTYTCVACIDNGTRQPMERMAVWVHLQLVHGIERVLAWDMLRDATRDASRAATTRGNAR